VVERFYGHRGFVYAVAFSPDNQTLASASEDRSVRLWEVATGHESAAFHGHTNFVWDVVFFPDGQEVTSASQDLTVKIWKVSPSLPITLRGHDGWVSDVAFSPDSRQVGTRHDSPRIAAFNGNFVGKDETKVWDSETGRERASSVGSAADSGPTFGPWGRLGDVTATSPDGRLIAKRGDPPRRNEVDVTNSTTGRVLYTLKGHTERVSNTAFSPRLRSRRIATASWDGTVKIWDAENGLELLTLRGHTAGVCCLAFSPDGDRLLSGSIDATAILWDARPLPTEALPADSSAQ
jgi:WD40 repeat protein